MVDGEGEMAAVIETDVKPGEPIEIPPVALQPAGLIAGIVSEKKSDDYLSPLVEVEVVATPTSLVDTLANAEDTGTRSTSPPAIKLEAHTRADGTYEIRGVPPGTYSLTASKDGFQPGTQVAVVQAGLTTPGDFVLDPLNTPGTANIKGTVTEAASGTTPGGPIEDAIVVALPPQSSVGTFNDLADTFDMPKNGSTQPGTTAGAPGTGRSDGTENETRHLATETDANGNYNLHLPAGNYLLVAAKPGYVPQGKTITVTAGQDLTQDFSLQPEPTEPTLKVEVGADHPSYPVGQTVNLTGTVTNISKEPLTLIFGGSEFGFAVFNSKHEIVWRQRLPASASSTVTQTTLQPGESKTWNSQWNQEDLLGQQVAADSYDLVGQVMAMPSLGTPNLHPRRSQPFPFTIQAPTP
jgi:hypothetical protein